MIFGLTLKYVKQRGLNSKDSKYFDMKHYYYLILAVFICCIFACCNEKSNEVIISGQLEGVEDGIVINLMKPEGNMSVTVQSDSVMNGAFRFSYIDTLYISKPMHVIARGEGFPPTWLEIWVRPGAEIKITGKDKMTRSWSVSSILPEQIESNRYKAHVEQFERVSQSVMREAYSYWDVIMKNPEGNSSLKAKIDSLYAINDSMSVLVMETEVNIMFDNKTYSHVWMEKLNRYVKSLKYTKVSDVCAEKLKSMYEGMSDELKNSEKGQSVYINLYPPVIVKEGDYMADTDMWNLKGELHHLEDYKGKYLLLDFWSAGCGPCIMAIPEMKEISEMYKDKLTVVSISSDTKDVWEKVSKEKDVTWVNLNDFKGENGIKLRYGVRGIPHYVMISPEGKITTSWLGYGEGSLKRKMEENIK